MIKNYKLLKKEQNICKERIDNMCKERLTEKEKDEVIYSMHPNDEDGSEREDAIEDLISEE